VTCAALTRSCSTAARCAALILRRQGITAWYGYTGHRSTCDRYSISECNLSGGTGPRPTPPAPKPTPTPPRPCNVGARRGACIHTSSCSGSRESIANHCPLDPPLVRCCVQKQTPTPTPPRPVAPPAIAPSPGRTPGYGATPTTNCDIVTASCSQFKNRLLVDREFMPYVTEWNSCAKSAGTTIHVTSSYRTLSSNAGAGGVSSSNHLAGHAIDMNVIGTNGRLCNSVCLRKSNKDNIPGVQATINCWNRLAAPSRWGGNPAFNIRISSGLDSVHLDDSINSKHRSIYNTRRTKCRASPSATVSCGSGGGASAPAAVSGGSSATPCTAHGKPGVCKTTSSCGTQSFSYRANIVEGCRHLPANVRCCVNNAAGSSPPRPAPKPVPKPTPRPPAPAPKPVPAPANAPACNANGISGRCIDVSTCTGSNTSARGFCPGPANIRCCYPRGAQPPPTPAGSGAAWISRAGRYARLCCCSSVLRKRLFCSI
jgi:hypothetical protein